MALSRFSNAISQQNRQLKNKLESRRPRMLKDLLQEDTNSSTQQLVVATQNHNTVKLLRSRSTKATLSALHAIINALKNIPFTTKSPSSKLSNKIDDNCTAVTVKDIMRWKSFRDLAEENSPPSEIGCTTTTTTSASRCSNGSSWCDSDFGCEYEDLPEDDKYLPCVGVGGDCMETTTKRAQDYNGVGPEGDAVCEEEEQYSPLSVLQVDSQFSEDAHPFCSSHLSLANVDNRKQHKLLQKLEFELEEEEANEGEVRAMMVLHKRWYQTRNIDEFDEYENEMAKCWIVSGDDNKEVCIREMEKGESWSKFDDEQQQLCFQIQEHLLDSMVDDLLIHLFVCKNDL